MKEGSVEDEPKEDIPAEVRAVSTWPQIGAGLIHYLAVLML